MQQNVFVVWRQNNITDRFFHPVSQDERSSMRLSLAICIVYGGWRAGSEFQWKKIISLVSFTFNDFFADLEGVFRRCLSMEYNILSIGAKSIEQPVCLKLSSKFF